MAAMAPVWVNSCCALAAAAALVFFRVSSEQPTSECQTPASHCRQRDVCTASSSLAGLWFRKYLMSDLNSDRRFVRYDQIILLEDL